MKIRGPVRAGSADCTLLTDADLFHANKVTNLMPNEGRVVPQHRKTDSIGVRYANMLVNVCSKISKKLDEVTHGSLITSFGFGSSGHAIVLNLFNNFASSAD